MQRLIRVYICQNYKLLEISCSGSLIKDNHKNQQHGGKYFANRPHSDPGGWVNRPHSDTGGWVNRPHSDPGGWVNRPHSDPGGWVNRPHSDPGGWVNRPHSDPGGWVKIQLFQNMIMLHIKKGITSRMQQHSKKYFACRTPPSHTHKHTSPPFPMTMLHI